MIRINVTEKDLLAEIKLRSKKWLDSARKTQEVNKAAKKYEVSNPKWSKIKGAYIAKQKGRCAYCERELTIDEREGGNEWDVEHFRPKSSVSEWPTARIREERGIEYKLPNSKKSSVGYYLLSHHPFNYVVSCKTCNSKFKGNYFPVQNSPRLVREDDPRKMKAEGALLIYPLGSLDENPEDLIGFDGVLPYAKANSEDRKLRAKVNIDFFELAERPTLITQRAEAISHLATNLSLCELPGAHQNLVDKAKKVIELMLIGHRPHTNCMRSFKWLYDNDKAKATKIAERAEAIYFRDLGSNS